jgi:hypothetical protein
MTIYQESLQDNKPLHSITFRITQYTQEPWNFVIYIFCDAGSFVMPMVRLVVPAEYTWRFCYALDF